MFGEIHDWLNLPRVLWEHDLDPEDPSERDPAFIERHALPALRWLRQKYFRIEHEGVEHVPSSGPFLAVVNHGGGPMLADMLMMVSFWWEFFGIEHPAHALVHDAAFRVPGLRNLLIKMGALRACPRSADRALEQGSVLLVAPGGDLEVLRSFRQRNRVDFHGHTGFISIALRHGVPILPIVNVGGHEVYFTLLSSPTLARWTGFQRLTGVKTLSLHMGLPWGIWWSGLVPFLPLPAKLSYAVGKPFAFSRQPERAEDAVLLQRTYVQITDTMQGMVDDLAARRIFPVLG